MTPPAFRRVGFSFMSLSSEIAADLAEIASDIGTTCTFNDAADVPCSASFVRRGEEIDYGGKVVTIQLTIIVAATLMAEPNIGDTITYQTVKRRIVRKRFAPTETHYELDCIDLSEKR